MEEEQSLLDGRPACREDVDSLQVRVERPSHETEHGRNGVDQTHRIIVSTRREIHRAVDDARDARNGFDRLTPVSDQSLLVERLAVIAVNDDERALQPAQPP